MAAGSVSLEESAVSTCRRGYRHRLDPRRSQAEGRNAWSQPV